jgi:Fe-S oxidoreductase
MARYKSEVLHRAYRRRIRPITHYSLGWLPRWLRGLERAPALVPRTVNRVLQSPTVRAAAGIDRRRAAPALAPTSFRRQWRVRPVEPPVAPAESVVLWADSFTNRLNPDAAIAAVDVLRAAGHRVVVPGDAACCGLTWITTGQLIAARRRLVRLLDVFEPYVRQGVPIVGLEPSCTAVLRSDLLDLLPDDPRATRVAAATRTLAETLTAAVERGWRPPDLTGLELIVQPHCHQHAVMGFDIDRALLTSMGATVSTLAGCCGLAGNFGMERGHYEMSVAVAETGLLPALRARPAGAIVLADGFSCRTQINQLAGLASVTLAQLLADRLPAHPVRHR